LGEINVWVLQFVSKLIFSQDQGVCHFLLLHFVPNLFIRGIGGKINVLAPTVCFKIDFFSRDQGVCNFFCSYSLYQTCLSEVLRVKKNVLAPTVGFKIDFCTTSGSMPLFCSYSLYEICSFEVLWLK